MCSSDLARPDGAGSLFLELGICGGWIVDAVAAVGGPDFFVDGEAEEAFGFEVLRGGGFAGAGDAAEQDDCAVGGGFWRDGLVQPGFEMSFGCGHCW